MLRFLSIALLSLAALSPANLAAQRAGGPPAVAVTATAGGKSYQGTGPGSCRHTPDASIYDVPAALWMVEQGGSANGALKALHLTLWRPKNGAPDQVSLALETKSSTHQISVGGKAQQMGSAKVKLSPVGSGGRFELRGKDAKGTVIRLTINCTAFAGVEAEGG